MLFTQRSRGTFLCFSVRIIFPQKDWEQNRVNGSSSKTVYPEVQQNKQNGARTVAVSSSGLVKGVLGKVGFYRHPYASMLLNMGRGAQILKRIVCK